MPFLRKITSPILNHMIPSEYKEEAVQSFILMTSELSLEDFQALIDKNISLWQQCMNDDLRSLLKASMEMALAKTLTNLIPDALMLDWVLEARPELQPAFSTPEGRLWFFRQVTEIKREVGA